MSKAPQDQQDRQGYPASLDQQGQPVSKAPQDQQDRQGYPASLDQQGQPVSRVPLVRTE